MSAGPIVDQPTNVEACFDLPPQWTRLAARDAPDVREQVARLVKERVAADPAAEAVAEVIAEILVDSSRENTSQTAAVRWELQPIVGLTLAHVTLDVVERVVQTAGAALDEVLAFLREAEDPLDYVPPLISEPALPLGPAVLVDAMKAVHSAADDGPPRDTLHRVLDYWVAVEEPAVLVQARFSTASLSGADRLVAEFAAIAATLRLEVAP